ncbi:DUF559 domain-containing protein [Microbacterium sp.]|uniref:endonuclease domain-containing protein n=1 Tax=Microbacterium sp. TaxID=51671 RepID=UPI00289F849C|nr:DUF559 domain-containing protein [Microbacterium sp.]
MEDLATWIRRRGGVAHARVVSAAGYSKHTVAKAIASRAVERVRRSWLLVHDVAHDVRAAASVGGRVTCISAAAARGLWVPSHPPVPHISVPHSASVAASEGMLLHWATGPVPLPRSEPVENTLNLLFHVARCLPRADALAVWESAIRKGVADPAVLARVHWRSTRAAALAAVAGSLSDSGIETAFIELIRGLGLAVRQQVWIDGHPLDALIGDRLGIQIDGLAHHQGRDRRRDLRADARLALRGYTVLRFDYQQVLFDPQYVIDTILTAVAQGLHLAR